MGSIRNSPDPNCYVIASDLEVGEHIERMIYQLRNGLELFILVACGSDSDGRAQWLAEQIMAVVEEKIRRRYLQHYHRDRVHFRFE